MRRSLEMILLISTITLLSATSIARAEPNNVRYFDQKAFTEAIGHGGEIARFGTIRVLAGFHDKPGEFEIHENENDIAQIIEGEADFVTGGKAIGMKKTAKGELRGLSIEGGVVHHLKAGEILFIPAGVPHWYKSIQRTVKYSVIKTPRN